MNFFIFDMTYIYKDKLILRQYFTSCNGHDMLTHFAGGLDSRKFDKLEDKSIVVTSLVIHELSFNCFAYVA